MYCRCARQYEFRYVEGRKCPPGVALIEGSAHHVTIEEINKRIISGRSLPSLKASFETFEEYFAENKKQIRKWWGEKTRDVISRGKEMHRQYRKQFQPHFFPKVVEQESRYKIGDVEVLGYVDAAGLVNNKSLMEFPFKRIKACVDYKTVKRKKTKDDLENDFQLTHYGWWMMKAFRTKAPYVGFCCIRKDNFQSQWMSIQITPARIKWYRHLVLNIANSISKGIFPVRNPVGWECSAKFCGYYARCKGKVEKR